uniref:Uncharacterized protein n=1 Tax=Megaselia scalaris TaxID=36166 RepID=T1GX68_MEGSC
MYRRDSAARQELRPRIDNSEPALDPLQQPDDKKQNQVCFVSGYFLLKENKLDLVNNLQEVVIMLYWDALQTPITVYGVAAIPIIEVCGHLILF